jgi:hypothetical protein
MIKLIVGDCSVTKGQHRKALVLLGPFSASHRIQSMSEMAISRQLPQQTILHEVGTTRKENLTSMVAIVTYQQRPFD